MSFPSRTLVLSPEARDDFEDILLYGLTTWGEAQTLAYESALDRALRRLVRFPELGSARTDLCLGCRGLVVRHHVIVYRYDEPVITVSRILRAQRDLASQFSE